MNLFQTDPDIIDTVDIDTPTGECSMNPLCVCNLNPTKERGTLPVIMKRLIIYNNIIICKCNYHPSVCKEKGLAHYDCTNRMGFFFAYMHRLTLSLE